MCALALCLSRWDGTPNPRKPAGEKSSQTKTLNPHFTPSPPYLAYPCSKQVAKEACCPIWHIDNPPPFRHCHSRDLTHAGRARNCGPGVASPNPIVDLEASALSQPFKVGRGRGRQGKYFIEMREGGEGAWFLVLLHRGYKQDIESE